MNLVRKLKTAKLRMVGGDEEYTVNLPKQLHEVLVENGKMENPVISHEGNDAIEFSRHDWVYTVSFTLSNIRKKFFLRCKGLDTITDIYFNDVHIGRHENMFYPFECELKKCREGENYLKFYFHSPVKYLEELEEPEEWKGRIPRTHYLRKAPHDFEDFLGIKPCYPTVGIFDDICIYEYENSYIKNTRVSAHLDETGQGILNWKIQYKRNRNVRVKARIKLKGPKGQEVEEIKELPCDAEEAILETVVRQPYLWWPRGYGEQNMYMASVELVEEGKVVDKRRKYIGFRKLECIRDFDFHINNIPIKLWGANLVPITGGTHVFDEKKAEELIAKAVYANMNMLRFWGGGEPFPEKLYEMADKAGILVWTEMFHKWGMYPDSDPYMQEYKKEAMYMLEKTQGHPSVIIWSGGNESIMGAKLDHPEEAYIGNKIFAMYRELIERNTEAFYIENSPSGGAFPNDPREGDFHGWNHLWYIPYDKYPVFFSENSRVSTPGIKSLKKYIPDNDKLWPEGFLPHLGKFEDSLFPEAWQKLKTGPEPYWCSPIEQFYDASTPEELIYKCGEAHAQFMKRTAERLKRGRPSWDKLGERRCKGQLIWKFNDSWPQIFCSLLDYDLEPGHAYYGVKRGFEPVQVSFAIEDNISIWGVNDTGKDFYGTMEFVLFSPKENKKETEFREKIKIPAGESVYICDLDRLAQFKRENVLYARLKDEAGNIVSRNYEFTEIERNLYFPEAKLSLTYEDQELIIQTDKYARCIELKGEKDGDEFGFLFEDNYFDLMPFETRHIKVFSEKKNFKIYAKAFYSPYETQIRVNIPEKREYFFSELDKGD